MTLKSTLIFATATAIALTSFNLRPAAAAPEGGPAIAKQNAGADEFSSQRRRRARGVNPAVPLAAFGAIIGTIATVAAANREREAYERHYRGHYYEPPHHGPYAYQPHVYQRPVYQPRVYQRHVAPAPVYRQHRGYGGYHGPVAPTPAAPQSNFVPSGNSGNQ